MKLKGEARVRMLLALVPYFRERQYSGNYYDNDDVNDILDAIERAGLTDRQREIIQLIFFEDLTQTAAARQLRISQPTIREHEERAVARITEAYERGNSDEFK